VCSRLTVGHDPSMDTDTKDADRAEVMRKLRQTAIERQQHLRDLADRLQGMYGILPAVRDEAAAQLRQLAGE
jgi:hypothetical protein